MTMPLERITAQHLSGAHIGYIATFLNPLEFNDPARSRHMNRQVTAKLRTVYHNADATYVEVLNPRWPFEREQLLEYALKHDTEVSLAASWYGMPSDPSHHVDPSPHAAVDKTQIAEEDQ